MPKLPKFSELTDFQGMLNKVKSAMDSFMGPDTSKITEEAIAQEKDPTKAKLLEIELLINQLHDIQVIQNKTINALKTKYLGVKTLFETLSAQKEMPSDSISQHQQPSAPVLSTTTQMKTKVEKENLGSKAAPKTKSEQDDLKEKEN